MGARLLIHSIGGYTLCTMIYAIGIDLAEVARVRLAIERHGERFLQRVFTAGERSYCERFHSPWERYAARFAAKEAGMKALGTGWHGVGWRDFEVGHEPGGRPRLNLHGPARARAEQLGIRCWALSLTHTREYAMAEVLAEI